MSRSPRFYPFYAFKGYSCGNQQRRPYKSTLQCRSRRKCRYFTHKRRTQVMANRRSCGMCILLNILKWWKSDIFLLQKATDEGSLRHQNQFGVRYEEDSFILFQAQVLDPDTVVRRICGCVWCSTRICHSVMYTPNRRFCLNDPDSETELLTGILLLVSFQDNYVLLRRNRVVCKTGLSPD